MKWYQKDWFLWICLIIFAPAGIFLLWKSKRYSRKTTIILTVVFIIWFLFMLGYGQANKKTKQIPQETQQETNQSENKQVKSESKSSKDELLKNISVSLDYQDVSDKKRKVVLTVTNNNADYTFDGGVDVNFKDATGSSAGHDALMDKKIAPNSNTTVILWGKENASDADYKINGKFTEATQDTQAQTQNDYELISTLQGQDYNSFYVVVPSIDKDSLTNIVKEFKSKYTKDSLANGFQIGFFLKDNEADAKNQDFSTAKAMYHANYNNGLSELYINDTDETIDIN